MNQRIHKSFKLNGISHNEQSLLKKINSNRDLLFLKRLITSWFDTNNFLEVKTSGSTGNPKKIKIPKEDFIESCLLTQKTFDLNEKSRVINCLPVDYIAGKMMFIRALVSGFDIYTFPIKSNPIDKLKSNYDLIAMTSLQLENSINQIEKIKNVIVGGGPVQNDLKRKIQGFKNRIFETYGMTESLTHVAIKNLTNNEKNFHALDGITFAEKSGCLLVNTPHLSTKQIQTNDEVNLHSKTEFSWLGRKDFIINSGGVKINPEKLEKKLIESYDQNFVISSIADKTLGQKLVIVFEKKIPENWIKSVGKFEKILRPKKAFCLKKFLYVNAKTDRKYIKNCIEKLSN